MKNCREVPRCRRYWGKSGSDSDIAKPTRLTHNGPRPRRPAAKICGPIRYAAKRSWLLASDALRSNNRRDFIAAWRRGRAAWPLPGRAQQTMPAKKREAYRASRTLVLFTKRFLHLIPHTRGDDPEFTAIERSEIEFPRTIEAGLMQANRTSHFAIYAGHSVVESAASILDFFQSAKERLLLYIL